MNLPLEITGLTKVFDTDTGPFVAVQDFNAKIEIGDFVCLLGHSGCGKSTILSILAGLEQATVGGVCIDGKEVNTPGTDRGVVFQAPCLLPWLTAEKNVALAAGQAFPKSSNKERKERARKYLEMLGVGEFCDQTPAELSLGTQQRVSLARALVLEPRFLLLDEPFGMLDSLTRFDLQDTLLQVWEQTRKTVVMVTHDIDEALYLANHILLMTDGPAGRLGKIMRVPFARPRDRAEVLKRPDYYSLRTGVIEFLEDHAQPSANRWTPDAMVAIQ
jgi:nitrate ABC transporter ATP-binding subunit